ncbi:hypothetical protein [Streptomyces sp. NBC_01363]|uniref:hypothetical protein n=1 Tax=Streptomyces sp. NBC_01363 TaxID=2903840 RepID=UPI002256994A|nr:hypothetical protein [Streptomyces sp. NBC_01363]MCX4736518.1 hypothetical protein [Streptomyces sp. NBC_01363]
MMHYSEYRAHDAVGPAESVARGEVSPDRTPDGLPLGVQFVGPLGGEGTLLALAAGIEAERPWAHLEPSL